MTGFELTVADINEINRRLSQTADYRKKEDVHAVADLQWKLVALGQQIEDAAKRQPASSEPPHP